MYTPHVASEMVETQQYLHVIVICIDKYLLSSTSSWIKLITYQRNKWDPAERIILI